MARPTSPLITRDAVVERALEVIDSEGLEALSIRRLGREFGVSSAALYHHFENKEEIVTGAAELALRRTPLLDVDIDDDPQEMLVRGAHGLRDMLNAHPALMPVLVDRRRLGVGDRLVERAQERLERAGLDRSVTGPCLDMLERLVIGTVYRSALTDGSAGEAEKAAFDRAARGVVSSFSSSP